MTRKDYELVAKALRSMPSHAMSLRTAKVSAIFTLQAAFLADNPKFDSVKFMNACGLRHDEVLDTWVVDNR